jgi:hypothetical protein
MLNTTFYYVAWLVPLFLLVVGLCWVYSQRGLFLQGLRSLRWHRTNGRIIDREDRSFSVPGLVGFAATGVGLAKYRETGHYFEYEVGMTRYVNDMHSFGVHLDKATARYTLGDHIPVYFDPENPRNSVLHRGLPPGVVISLVPAIVGAGFLIWRICA